MILPEGTKIYGRYTIKSCIGQGGFGITYLANDERLMQDVVLKEYFPDFMVKRIDNNEVSIIASADIETYEKGKERFMNEARLLAALRDMSEIVTIFDFFTENNTAYIVMEYIDGQSLKELIKQRTEPYTFEEAMEIMNPCLAALQKVHEHGLIHRDFTPDNILITKNGDIRIIDFGASKDYISQEKTMTVMVKHGFAPLEQYAQDGHQGTWTDVYSACAIIYLMLTLEKPQSAIDRSMTDYVTVYSIANSSLSQQKKNVIIKGLSINASERFQTLKELIEALNENDLIDAEVTENVNGQYATYQQPYPQQFYTEQTYSQQPYSQQAYAINENTYNDGTYNGYDNAPVSAVNPEDKKKSSAGLIVGCVVAALIVLIVIITVTVTILSVASSSSKKAGTSAAKESKREDDSDKSDKHNNLDESDSGDEYVEPTVDEVEAHDTTTGNWDISIERKITFDEIGTVVYVPAGYYYITEDMPMDDPYIEYFFDGSELDYKEYCKEMEDYKVYLVMFPEDNSSNETFYLCGDKDYDGGVNYNDFKSYSDSEIQDLFDAFKQEMESDGEISIDAVFKGYDVADNFLIGYKAHDVNKSEASIKVAAATGTHNIWIECYLKNSNNTDHMVDTIVDVIQNTTYY